MSGNRRMTVRQIAEAAGCNHKTVREAVERLYPGRARNGVRLEFDAHESFAIMAELPKRNMVGPSQKREADLPESGKVHRLPAGIQLRELRLMAEKRILSAYQVQQVLGVAAPPAALPAPERPATDAEIEEGFTALRTLITNQRQALPPGAVDRVVRAAVGATRKTMEAILDHEKAASRQPTLGGLS